MIDRSGRALERFLTTGIDPETHERIGELPHGRGILGVLIRDAHALRLHDLTADRRAVGFPPHHPLMRTFLGVPILLRGVAYGNLYLTEKEGGEDFTAEDEELTTLLAAQAAVAIENARLYESATRWLAQLESLTEVGNALAGETELEPLLELIATRLRALIGAELVVIALPIAPAATCGSRRRSAPSADGLLGSIARPRAARRAAASSSGGAASASTRRSTTSRSTRRSPAGWASARACSCPCSSATGRSA